MKNDIWLKENGVKSYIVSLYTFLQSVAGLTDPNHILLTLDIESLLRLLGIVFVKVILAVN